MGQPAQLKPVIGGKKASRVGGTPAAATADGADKLMHRAVDALPCLVWVGSDSSEHSGWANAAWRDYTGMESTNWLHAVHPENVERMQRLWDEALERKVGFQEEAAAVDHAVIDLEHVPGGGEYQQACNHAECEGSPEQRFLLRERLRGFRNGMGCGHEGRVSATALTEKSNVQAQQRWRRVSPIADVSY